jgi:hypothetical protein
MLQVITLDKHIVLNGVYQVHYNPRLVFLCLFFTAG